MSHPNEAPMDLHDFLKAQKKEYETYVCTDEIFAGMARAFNVGDPVPASTVERYPHWRDGDEDGNKYVALRNSKEGRAAMGVPEPDEAPKAAKAVTSKGGDK